MSPILVSRGSIVTGLLLLLSIKTQTMPIDSGLSIKLKPFVRKDNAKPKTFGSLFTKIPQELQEVSSQALLPQIDLGLGCTNQIARLLFPVGSCYLNHSEMQEKVSFINIPILKQKYDDYKIIVVTAPKHIRVGRGEDSKPLVIYIVFSEDDANDTTINMPKVYFVNRKDEGKLFKKDNEPIFIIDNNRTVTGLKSTEISKYVKFKNKFTNRIIDDKVGK